MANQKEQNAENSISLETYVRIIKNDLYEAKNLCENSLKIIKELKISDHDNRIEIKDFLAILYD